MLVLSLLVDLYSAEVIEYIKAILVLYGARGAVLVHQNVGDFQTTLEAMGYIRRGMHLVIKESRNWTFLVSLAKT